MSDAAFNIGEFLQETADIHRRLVKQGISIGEERRAAQIRAITAAYRKALGDPNARIPSYLEAAIRVAEQEAPQS